MPIKLTVLLFKGKGPWHWACKHVAAVAEDLESEKKFDINFDSKKRMEEEKAFTVYSKQQDESLSKYLEGNYCCLGSVTLYSEKNFDTFVTKMQNEFFGKENYHFCKHNCADSVSLAIDELCPEKACTDVACWMYKALCCPLFFGSLALSCFPAPPCACSTPQDIYDKARWLSKVTSYGTPKNIEYKSENSEKKETVANLELTLKTPLLTIRS